MAQGTKNPNERDLIMIVSKKKRDQAAYSNDRQAF
jgi:hypothetical protein